VRFLRANLMPASSPSSCSSSLKLRLGMFHLAKRLYPSKDVSNSREKRKRRFFRDASWFVPLKKRLSSCSHCEIMPTNGAPSSAMTSGAKQSGTVEARYHQYQVVGRLKPSAQKGTRKSTIYKMNVFAPNTVVAKSRFWYYMSMLNRVKKANGEILQINEVTGVCLQPPRAPACQVQY
jgi:hypothetical protein